MAYTPNPPGVIQEMLDSLGMEDIDELFIDIPREHSWTESWILVNLCQNWNCAGK